MITVLILGGTGDAAALALALSGQQGVRTITSLAGRTRKPETLPGEVRTGGFGGVEGLSDYLSERSIDVLIDATHPFARQMGSHAVLAADRVGIPRLRLIRPAWEKQAGDRWIDVADAAGAAEALGSTAKRVFLTSGHRDLDAFAGLDALWFLIRTIEPPAGPLPKQMLCLRARGPFDENDECALLQEHHIDTLVTKASGGTATYPKIATARKLRLPVIMIRRPEPPPGPTVHDTAATLTWLRQVTA